jgi:hypothetical protein
MIFFAQRACQPATMTLFEFRGIRQPAERIAERADRKLDQNIAILGGIIVHQQTFALLPDFKTEADEIAFGTVDPAGFDFRLEQDIAGIEVAHASAPGMIALRQEQPTAIIEIKPQAFGTKLRWGLGGGRIGAFRRR